MMSNEADIFMSIKIAGINPLHLVISFSNFFILRQLILLIWGYYSANHLSINIALILQSVYIV